MIKETLNPNIVMLTIRQAIQGVKNLFKTGALYLLCQGIGVNSECEKFQEKVLTVIANLNEEELIIYEGQLGLQRLVMDIVLNIL